MLYFIVVVGPKCKCDRINAQLNKNKPQLMPSQATIILFHYSLYLNCFCILVRFNLKTLVNSASFYVGKL